jgi:hypothetical protein
MDTQEQIEHIELIGSHHKRAALLSAVFAVALAILEVGGHAAQNRAADLKLESNALWNYFLTQNVRRTVLQSFTEAIDVLAPRAGRTDETKKQIDEWQKTIDRLRNNPESDSGYRQIVELAQKTEAGRDRASTDENGFKLASVIVQIAIIVVSASVIMGAIWLTWFGAVIGLSGCALGLSVWAGFHLLL